MHPSFKTDRSAELYERACRSLATGVSSGIRRNVTPVPLYFAHADGPYFFDVDGHQLLDYTLAWGPLIVGSNHPLVNARVAEQLLRCGRAAAGDRVVHAVVRAEGGCGRRGSHQDEHPDGDDPAPPADHRPRQSFETHDATASATAAVPRAQLVRRA